MSFCFEKLKEKFGTIFGDEELKGIFEDVKNIYDTAKDPLAAKKRVKDYYDEIVFEHQLYQRTARIDAIKLNNAIERVVNSKQKDPVDALISILDGTHTAGEGERRNVLRDRKVLDAKLKNQLVLALREKDLLKLARSGDIDKEIAIEMWNIDKNIPMNTTDEARGIAAVLHNMNKLMFQAKQNAGIPIRHYEGYIAKSVHDPARIRQSGKTYKEAFDSWASSIYSKLDIESTFGQFAENPAKQQEMLQTIFDEIMSGTHGEFTVAKRGRLGMGQRTLHFTDGAAWNDYNNEFGRNSLLESFQSAIAATAKQVSIVNHFGSTADLNWGRVEEKLRGRFKEDAEKIRMLDSGREKLRQFWDEVKGLNAIPGKSVMAKVSKNARKVSDIAMMGKAGIRSITDIAVTMGTLRSSTGKNIFESLGEAVSGYANSLKKEHRNEVLTRAHMYVEDVLGELHGEMAGSGTYQPGEMSKTLKNKFNLNKQTITETASTVDDMIKWAHNKIYVVNGASFMTKLGKTANARQTMLWLNDNSHHTLESMPAQLSRDLKAFDIDEKDWAVIKQAREDMDGKSFITPEGITKVSDESITAIKGAMSARALTQYRSMLDFKLAGYIGDIADTGVPTPNARDRHFWIRGTKEDDPAGQVARFIAQWKMYPTSIFRIMRRISVNPDGALDWQGLTGTFVAATTLGYIGQMLVDILAGKTPKDPRDIKTITEAMVKGGSAGMFGDMLYNEYDSYSKSFIKGLTGPVLGSADKVAAMMSQSIRGEGKHALSSAIDLMHKNTPLASFPLIDTMFKNLVLYHVQEELNPGTIGRMEKKAKEAGQEFYISPR
jgi:hypothetical protein